MKKRCSCCNEDRDTEEDFKWKYKARGIRMSRCKYCQAELSKLHYQNNKQIYNERSRAYKAKILSKNRPKLYTYLSTHPCVDCGQAEIYLLEFDHVRDQKYGKISDLLRQGSNWSIIETEVAKCEVRCANCHRIKTFCQHDNWRTAQLTHKHSRGCYQQIHAYLSNHPCVDCGITDIRLLEFDHIRGHKTAHISRLLTQGRNWSTIESEIAKCEVCCANCHRKRTYERAGNWWRANGGEL